MLWIDQNNKLHDDMNGEALSLPSWPQGMRQATQSEIDSIANPPMTTDEFKQLCEASIQNFLDNYAKSWGYDNIVSAASYANSTNLKFKNESLALISWRDSVWSWAESLTAPPSSIDALLLAMPVTPARPV